MTDHLATWDFAAGLAGAADAIMSARLRARDPAGWRKPDRT
ncbi:hypothetical protein [Amycolatopsis nalaikhensis]|uniref:Uncharacterized protein n=1 Tax=Amycolatopsis nalaikhensis TaxID=715472 RepID=A0ABY8XCW8_9PSEU|nr:hypothetical protein [Amycolatopsis sp. 2-2]WIV52966.1 hypothetical protein QP939_28965 [Amycolatopsis sp. 2-2]